MLLGARRSLSENRWKDDIAEAAQHLGWQVTHWDALHAPTGEVVAACKDADLFVWARTHGHDPAGDPAVMLRHIEDLGVPTVGIHMDLYWGLRNREPQIGAHPWWSCQYVFTADGGNQHRFAERGVNHHWMPPAMGVRFYGRVQPSGRYPDTRVVFVGSHVPRIHGDHRRQLLTWARHRYQHQFLHADGRHTPVWGAALSDLYASAHVALGDSAPAPYYWSDRIPTTLGRGGVLAHPRTEGLAEQGFTDDTMILYDRYDFTALGARIDSLTSRERANLSEAGLTVIGERHLWTHRLQQIERTVAA